jgi:hypothetical protein
MVFVLIGALRALQIMQDRAEIDAEHREEITNSNAFDMPNGLELDELIEAIGSGHLAFVWMPADDVARDTRNGERISQSPYMPAGRHL